MRAHKVRIYMKSGNQVDVKVKELTFISAGGKRISWETFNDQTKLKLIHVDMDQVEAVVRLR